jgi:hypothetical protein
VEADDTLALQGDNAYELFVIEEGEAEVSREGEATATLREGDVRRGRRARYRHSQSDGRRDDPHATRRDVLARLQADRGSDAGDCREVAQDHARARGSDVVVAPRGSPEPSGRQLRRWSIERRVPVGWHGAGGARAGQVRPDRRAGGRQGGGQGRRGSLPGRVPRSGSHGDPAGLRPPQSRNPSPSQPAKRPLRANITSHSSELATDARAAREPIACQRTPPFSSGPGA